MARNRDASTSTKPTKPYRSKPAGGMAPNRSRRALMALSPAALGAAGFLLSGLGRGNAAKAAQPDTASDDAQQNGGLTAHRKAYYDRARI